MSILPPITVSRVVDPRGMFTPMWQNWINTVQKALAPSSSFGTTAQRPTTSLYIGQRYFDQTLGYPVYVKQYSPSIVWVNGAGATV